MSMQVVSYQMSEYGVLQVVDRKGKINEFSNVSCRLYKSEHNSRAKFLMCL
jgi:hypothetical protein